MTLAKCSSVRLQSLRTIPRPTTVSAWSLRKRDENGKAYGYLQRALKVRPIYPEALNNLGVLYLVTHRRDEAVASFEQCIRVAPAFDQAYLNLARVYALEGARRQGSQSYCSICSSSIPIIRRRKQMLEQLQQ